MSKLIPSSPHSPCPICGDTSGDCRHGEELNLCHDYIDQDPQHPDYKWLKASKDGIWGVFVLREDDDNFDRQAWEERKRQEEASQSARFASALPVSFRDKPFRKIAKRVGLTKRHHQALLDRGLDKKTIEDLPFFSVAQNQPLPPNIPTNLPGVGHGDRLLTSVEGIAVPVLNPLGKVLSYQTRVDGLTEGGKYRWFKGLHSSHLPNGELPIQVLGEPENKTAHFCEGTLKPLIAAYLHGGRWVGASGGNFNGSPEQVEQALEGVKTVIIYPDGGDVLNPQVMGRWEKQVKFLRHCGFKVKIAWWGQVDKKAPDVDEVTPGTSFGLISPKKFFAKGRKLTNTSRKSRENSAKSKFSDPVVVVNQRYIPDLKDLIPQGGIFGLKAAKGSGKSYQIKKLIAAATKPILFWQKALLLWAMKSLSYKLMQHVFCQVKRIWKTIISLTPRIALGREQAFKWEIAWIEDGGETVFFEEIEIDLEEILGLQTALPEGEELEIKQKSTLKEIVEKKVPLPLDELPTIGLCPDSLGKIANKDWSGALVILDEVELLFQHLLLGKTCEEKRPHLLMTLERKLKQCLNGGGLLFASDADLRQRSLDYLKQLSPPNTPVKVLLNTHKPLPWKVKYYRGKAGTVKQQIFEAVENGQNIAVTVDNKDEAIALQQALYEAFPYLKLGNNTVVISSDTTREKWGQDFVKNPDYYLSLWLPRVLIYTPSLGVGVSIEVDHFHQVFGIFTGVVEPSQARQMLARIRNPVPRTIWASESGRHSKQFDPIEIQKNLLSCAHSSQLVLGLAQELAGSGNDWELLKSLNSLFSEKKGAWNNPHLDFYCKLLANRNQNISRLADQLLLELQEEGHDISLEEGSSSEQENLIKTKKEEVKKAFAQAWEKAEEIPLEKAETIAKKPYPTPKEYLQSQKAFLTRDLPGVEQTADFIYKAIVYNRRSWLRSQELYWYCHNPEVRKELDRKHWFKKLKAFAGGVPYPPDLRLTFDKVDLINKLGLLELVEGADTLGAYDQAVQDFRAKSLKLKDEVKRTFELTITKETKIIPFLNQLLAKIGLKLTRANKSNKSRRYRLDTELMADQDRQNVLAALDRRFFALSEQLSKAQKPGLVARLAGATVNRAKQLVNELLTPLKLEKRFEALDKLPDWLQDQFIKLMRDENGFVAILA